jgi:hypothetical protein
MNSLITKKLIAGATVAGMLAPLVMFAQSATSTTPPPAAKNPMAFCINVDAITNQVYNVMLQVQAYYGSSRNMAVANAAYASTDAKIAKATADAYAQTINIKVYNALSVRAKTQEQKDALTSFKNTYDAASAAMKSANNLAINDYKAATNKIMAGRHSTITDSMMAYTTAINAAIAKAKADCKSGTDAATAYSTFTAGVKAANTNIAAKSKMGEMKAQLEPLNQALVTALKTSQATFKATVSPAWKAVTAALGVPATPDAPATI